MWRVIRTTLKKSDKLTFPNNTWKESSQKNMKNLETIEIAVKNKIMKRRKANSTTSQFLMLSNQKSRNRKLLGKKNKTVFRKIMKKRFKGRRKNSLSIE